MNGIRDVFNRALKTRRSSAYFFVEHNEVQNGESSNTINDQQELLSMDKPKMPNRRPLVRSYTQLGLENLHNDSKFTQKEVNELYREFKLECPAGYITKDNFQFLFQKFFPMGGSGRYAGYVFDTFERDVQDRVTFRSFLLGMSVLSRGNKDEKLRWIFNLYDIDKNGYITQSELTEIVSAVFEMRNNPSGSSLSAYSAKDTNTEAVVSHATNVFQKMDVNGDGFVSFDEFVSACNTDPDIRDSIGTLGGGIRATRY